MGWLERKLRPTATGSMWSDLAVVGLLGLLAATLLPGWADDPNDFVPDYVGQLVPSVLPASLGVLLALRAGAVDLSYWGNFQLAAATAVPLMQAGVAPWLCMLAGTSVGLATGTLSALLVWKARLPSALVTLAIGAAIIQILGACLPAQPMRPPTNEFNTWHVVVTMRVQDNESDTPVHAESPAMDVRQCFSLDLTRMLIVASVYIVTMVGLLRADTLKDRRHYLDCDSEPSADRPGLVAVGLIGSAVLSAAGGAIGLLEVPYLRPPTQWLGDLRIPAAALLAGGFMLAGRGRTLLACVLLPPAMLVCGVWQDRAWQWPWRGYELPLAALGLLALAAHTAGHLAGQDTPGRRLLAKIALALIALAAGTWGLAQYVGPVALQDHLNLTAGVAAAFGITLTAGLGLSRRAKHHEPQFD